MRAAQTNLRVTLLKLKIPLVVPSDSIIQIKKREREIVCVCLYVCVSICSAEYCSAFSEQPMTPLMCMHNGSRFCFSVHEEGVQKNEGLHK